MSGIKHWQLFAKCLDIFQRLGLVFSVNFYYGLIFAHIQETHLVPNSLRLIKVTFIQTIILPSGHIIASMFFRHEKKPSKNVFQISVSLPSSYGSAL